MAMNNQAKIILLAAAGAAVVVSAIFAGYRIGEGNQGQGSTVSAQKEVNPKAVRGNEADSGVSGTDDRLSDHYVIAFPTPTPVPVIPAEIAAEEDFSPYAEAVVGNDGTLSIPDNSVVEDITSADIRTKLFSLTIPGCWVGNVVVQCRYVNNTEENFTDPVYDTMTLTFYEKKNYDAYRENGNGSTKAATRNGLLTELYFSSTKNDNSWMKTSNYENYWADVTEGVNTYEVFLYEPHDSAAVSSDEYADRCDYMTQTVNFEGCIIHGFVPAEAGTVVYKDPYTEKAYIKNWDPDQEGIPEGSTIP
ncbi:MAG: hypothetical protein LKM35_02500 [Lachnospiraceae bacterium]|nr:hypothetical protein [Lachnospiraceae bacterium]